MICKFICSGNIFPYISLSFYTYKNLRNVIVIHVSKAFEKGRYIQILDSWLKYVFVSRKSIHNLFKYHSKTFNLINMISSRLLNKLVLSNDNTSNANITFSINFFIIVPGSSVSLAPSFLRSFNESFSFL